MHLREQCTPAALEAVDQHEVPQRPGPVVGVLIELRRQVEQLAYRARLGQGDVADVMVQVELRVGCPLRRREPAEAGHDTVSQTRHHCRPVRDPGADAVELDPAVEHRDARTVRVEPRVLLDGPHQRLGVAHLALEPQLPRRPLPTRPCRHVARLVLRHHRHRAYDAVEARRTERTNAAGGDPRSPRESPCGRAGPPRTGATVVSGPCSIVVWLEWNRDVSCGASERHWSHARSSDRRVLRRRRGRAPAVRRWSSTAGVRPDAGAPRADAAGTSCSGVGRGWGHRRLRISALRPGLHRRPHRPGHAPCRASTRAGDGSRSVGCADDVAGRRPPRSMPAAANTTAC